ncbi:MAG: hypothetical protein ACK4UO_14660 [Pseudolabrys sp.]
MAKDEKRDEVLLRLLKTPPAPKAGKRKLVDTPPPDNDDPDALIDWAKRNIQKDVDPA